MAKFVTPAKYYLPLHHPRPRFKNYVEEVLGYVSFGIADIGKLPRKDFNLALDEHIRHYGANLNSTSKTIANWRTEIGAIFGLYIEDKTFCRPSYQCEDLAVNTNLPRFFRGVMAGFQYPAGFLKPNEVVKLVQAKVLFCPGRWLASYFLQPGSPTLTKEEFCHCVMNDLRVTRDAEPLAKTVARIEANRKSGVIYDSRGDVVRTAGDVLDYMYLASFLDKDSKGRYCPRPGSEAMLTLLRDTKNTFTAYEKGKISNAKATGLEYDWFVYAEEQYKQFIAAMDAAGVKVSKKTAAKSAEKQIAEALESIDGTSEIGKAGEMLAYQHEIMRVKNAERPDLVHLIKQIPTHLAAGYDIKSIEADTEEDRFIEVKTCMTRKRVHFNNFHLTPNEWRVADSHGPRYFVYRIAIDDEGCQLFVIQDPIQKFRERMIRISLTHSAQLNFTDKAGEFVELLCKPTK